MKNFLFLALLLSLSLAIVAAEDESKTTSPNKEPTETTKEKSTVNTPDSFDPTETLSQDVPTAFPVDI